MYPTNPKYVGPGIWTSFHLIAFKANDEETKKLYRNYFVFMAKYFPCVTCRLHIQELLKTRPIEDYWNKKDSKGRPVGLFIHSWLCHNDVNERIDKRLLDFETAYQMYASMCLEKDCVPEKESIDGEEDDEDITVFWS